MRQQAGWPDGAFLFQQVVAVVAVAEGVDRVQVKVDDVSAPPAVETLDTPRPCPKRSPHSRPAGADTCRRTPGPRCGPTIGYSGSPASACNSFRTSICPSSARCGRRAD